MTKFSMGRYARDALVPAVTVNVAGLIEPKLDNFMNAKVKFLSSSTTVNPTGAKYAKYLKMLTYTLTGLAVQAVTEVALDGSEPGEMIGEAIGTFMYGLSGATAAEDPVMNVPGPYRQAGNPQGGMPPRQVVTRTANFIS